MKKNKFGKTLPKRLLIAMLTAGMVTAGGSGQAILGAAAETTEQAALFEELSGWMFVLSSGVGGWGSTLVIAEDGSFEGYYYDSEMGDMGDAYPYGSYYQSSFTGTFSDPVQVDAYTYSVTLESLSYETPVGTEEIVDGLRYVNCEAFGIAGGSEFLIYLPSASLEVLPEDYIDWVSGSSETGETTLGYYGLYNVTELLGYSSYQILSELEALEQTAAQYEQLLAEAQTQTEMNSLAEMLYYLWDDELNDLWSRLKQTLDADAMSALTTEEIAWINEKEAAVEEAGREYEGGSMETMVEYLTAAEWTRERVYVLWDYLS